MGVLKSALRLVQFVDDSRNDSRDFGSQLVFILRHHAADSRGTHVAGAAHGAQINVEASADATELTVQHVVRSERPANLGGAGQSVIALTASVSIFDVGKYRDELVELMRTRERSAPRRLLSGGG